MITDITLGPIEIKVTQSRTTTELKSRYKRLGKLADGSDEFGMGEPEQVTETKTEVLFAQQVGSIDLAALIRFLNRRPVKPRQPVEAEREKSPLGFGAHLE